MNNTWIDEHLEEALDVMKKGVTSLKKANKHWNIPLTSLSNHLNGKTRSRKYGSLGVLIFDEIKFMLDFKHAIMRIVYNITMFN